MDHDKDYIDSDCVEVATGGHGRSEKAERRPSHSTSVDGSGRKKGDKRSNDGTSPEPSEAGAKKMKRGKYISRAWYVDPVADVGGRHAGSHIPVRRVSNGKSRSVFR
jgi:hypothetical protein